MNRKIVKIVLGIVIGMMLVCLVAGVATFALAGSVARALASELQSDPTQVAAVASGIADYDLPAGFGNAYATQVAGFSFVTYIGDDRRSHIYLFQLPAYIILDRAELERQAQQATQPRSPNRPPRMETVDRRQAIVRSQEITLTVREGVNSDGLAYREMSGIFQGKGGQALVTITGLIKTWDQAKVDAFLASIR